MKDFSHTEALAYLMASQNEQTMTKRKTEALGAVADFDFSFSDFMSL